MRLVVAAAILLLPAVVLLPVWPLAGLGASEDDLLYYLPSRVFFQECVQSGEAPWINPWTGLGRPFAADPQSALFYPTTWLFAVVPPLWAYGAGLYLHYGLALAGMYRLLRAQRVTIDAIPTTGHLATAGTTEQAAIASGASARDELLDRRAALFGAVAFAFCGFLLAHRAHHFSMQHAAAWAPWVIWRVQRYVQAGGGRRMALAALPAAMQAFAGHVQIAALTALGTLVLLVSASGFAGRSAKGAGATRFTQMIRVTLHWLAIWLCASAVFAVQLLPTLLYVRECTRGQRGFMDFVENSWNPLSVAGFLLPMFFGQCTPNFFDQPYWGPSHQVEQFGYPGLLVLLLAGAALRNNWRQRESQRVWVILAVFSLLLAMGLYGPICPLLYWLPGSNLFRAPARALLLFNLALAALAAFSLHDLLAAPTQRRARLRTIMQAWTRRPIVAALALIAIPVVLALAALPWLDRSTFAAAARAIRPNSPALIVPLVLLAASLAVLRLLARRPERGGAFWPLLAVLVADLAVIGWTIDVPANVRDARELLTSATRTEWLAALAAAEAGVDVAELSNSAGPPSADAEPAAWSIANAARDAAQRRDFDPLAMNAAIPEEYQQPRIWTVTLRRRGAPGEYDDPLSKAAANTNAPVHLPALTDYGPLQPRTIQQRFEFAPWGESPPTRIAELLADTGWMRQFNVGWVLLWDPELPAPADCTLVATGDAGWRLYRNSTAGTLAYFEDAAQLGAVRSERHSNHAFATLVDTWSLDNAREPVRVAASVLYTSGWRARAGGRELTVEPTAGGLLSTRVPAGETTRIEWSYFPPGLAAGAFISIATATALLIMAVWGSTPNVK